MVASIGKAVSSAPFFWTTDYYYNNAVTLTLKIGPIDQIAVVQWLGVSHSPTDWRVLVLFSID